MYIWHAVMGTPETRRSRPAGNATLPKYSALPAQLASLNDIDRRMLKVSFRVGRAMLQRRQLNYMR